MLIICIKNSYLKLSLFTKDRYNDSYLKSHKSEQTDDYKYSPSSRLTLICYTLEPNNSNITCLIFSKLSMNMSGE